MPVAVVGIGRAAGENDVVVDEFDEVGQNPVPEGLALLLRVWIRASLFRNPHRRYGADGPGHWRVRLRSPAGRPSSCVGERSQVTVWMLSPRALSDSRTRRCHQTRNSKRSRPREGFQGGSWGGGTAVARRPMRLPYAAGGWRFGRQLASIAHSW